MEKKCPYCFKAVGESDTVCPSCGKQVDIQVPYHHLRPGSMVKERYYIGAVLGQGGFGITYTGYDTLLGRKVAIKEYYPNGFVNRNNSVAPTVFSNTAESDEAFFEKGKQRFHDEARILARFAGLDGFVNVLDYFPENNTVYIVMEFLEGITLKEYINKNGKLSTRETFDLFLPVMNALQKIHQKQLIHRDISPDNIMLLQEGGRLRVKLIDFGAARNVSSQSQKSLTVMLKPGFAPIEQYGSNDEQGPWTDIYALCATIYKCITGTTPPPTPNRINNDKLQKPSELGADIDAETEAVLLKGMCVLPADRYRDINSLLDALHMNMPQSEMYPRSSVPANGSKAEAYSRSSMPTNAPRSGMYSRSAVPTNAPQSGMYSRSAVPTNAPQSGMYPRSATPTNAPQPGMYPRSATPTNAPQSGMYPPNGTKQEELAGHTMPLTNTKSEVRTNTPQPGTDPRNAVQTGKPQSREPVQPNQPDAGSSKKKLVIGIAAGIAVVVAVCLLVIPKLSKGGDVVTTEPSSSVASPTVTLSDVFIDPVNEWSEYDDLILQIKAETDKEKRAELMHQAEDILISTYCVVPIGYTGSKYLQKDYVNGVYSNPFADKYFMYATMGNGSDTLRLNFLVSKDSFDPALMENVENMSLAINYAVGLYTYDAKGKTTKACAAGYTVSDDGLTYTVNLKEGLKWSDGSPLTAADFEYSWKRAADQATNASYRYLFSGFAGYKNGEIQVTAENDTTLKFVLTAPCTYMEELMALPTYCPVKKEAVEGAEGWETQPDAWCQSAGFVCNGAYVCTAWVPGVSITFEKNPYFYNADQVTINKLEYSNIGDVYDAYQNGKLDFADRISSEVVESLTTKKDAEFHLSNDLGTFNLTFNVKSKLFEGRTPVQAAAMREAFSMLIDREVICEKLISVNNPANSFIPPGMADGNGGLFRDNATIDYFDAYAINNDREGTVAKARDLLESAGYSFGDDGKLSADTPITISYLYNEDAASTFTYIEMNLSVLGIETIGNVQDEKTFRKERQNGNFDMCYVSWVADFNDPINMLEMWVTSSVENDCQFGRFEGWDSVAAAE